ncbi:hypothetical protein [Luteolibacter soli]|uniref:Uncharacterized protein n=1 Tax=Luteolibacter soli TaxID=3135280 RepID=A0ABU9AVB1_9BACT
MTNIDWKHAFEKHGFHWSAELDDFVREYGTRRELHFLDGSDQINLLKSSYIELGAQYGEYVVVSKYLQQRVAPVGDYHRLDVSLFLTETGRLIGSCDYLLISWGDQHWRTAIPLILGGDTGFELGIVS